MRETRDVLFLDRASGPHIVTLTMVAGVAALAMNVFLPALPQMAEHFGTDYRLMQLSVAIYLAMNALLQVFLGPLADRYGRRPVLLTSFAVFVVATIGCIFAPNIGVFLAFRMMQAAVVTGFVLSRAIVRDMVPDEKQAASRIAYVTMGMSVVPMAAPTLGGWLADTFNWQATFWLQAVLGVAVFALMARDLGETRHDTGRSLGAQFAAYPDLLSSPRFWGYSLSAMFASGAFFAYLGGAPFVGDAIFGLDATMLGFLLGAPAVGYLVGNFLAGRFAPTFGINRMILAGNVLTAVGLVANVVLLRAEMSGPFVFFALMSFVGLGNGFVLPNANAGIVSVRPELAGSASGLGGAMMIGGGAAISAYVGSRLTVESGPMPLLGLMLMATFCALVVIFALMARARRLEAVA